jgi:hypothetical protein
MRAKTVNENEEIARFPLSDITFEDIEPYMKGEYNPSINISNDFMTSRQITGPKQFNWWKEDFTEKYGDDGDIIIEYKGRAKVVDNIKFNKSKVSGDKAISNFYKNTPSGGWTGD